MADTMIHFQDVSRMYHPDIVAVANINLRIRPGEFVSIVGQSGTGKTTLVRLLIAEERPDRGRIEIGGWDVTHIKGKDIPLLRRQMGVVFQDFKLLPQKTIYENVAFALEVSGASVKRFKKVWMRAMTLDGKTWYNM